MGLFGFGKKKSKKEAEPAVEPVDEDKVAAEAANAAAKAESAETVLAEPSSEYQGRGEERGPWDVNDEDVPDYDDYLDLGAYYLPFLQGIQLRIKANRAIQQVLGSTITFGSSSLEIEAFAAPKTLGLWDDVRGDLLEANKAASEVDGVFGTELKLPVNVKGGKTVNTRIVGVDGPRWMLRGIFSGKAAIDPDSPETEALNKFFADIVVERGEEPLAPRDLIPMHPPVAPAERKAAKAAAEAGEENGKKKSKKEAEPAVEPVDEDKVAAEAANAAAKAESAETVLAEPSSEYQGRGEERGPWDVNDEDVPDYDDYLDLGAYYLPFLQGIQLRIKANRAIQQVLGSTITFGSSSLEIEAFAAPKTLGLWDDVRGDLLEANKAASEVDGVFGTELKLPVNVKGGKTVNTRIVGVDGPRWMLRGIFSGKAAIDPDSPETEALNKFFADIVVERGEEPLAPRDLIPMHPPVAPAERKAAKAAAEAGEENGKEHFKDIPDNKPKGPLSQDQQTEVKTTLSRGPMFSEVR